MKTNENKKPSKNLQSRWLYFYGNPRKLRVFWMPLTILIGIERREALKDSTSGLLCFFPSLPPLLARARSEKLSSVERQPKISTSPQTLVFFFVVVFSTMSVNALKKSKYTQMDCYTFKKKKTPIFVVESHWKLFWN